MSSPDVRSLLIGWLPRLVGAEVTAVRPDPHEEEGWRRLVRVIDTGGPGRYERVLQTVQVTIDSYAETAYDAAELARRVDDAIHDLPSSPVPVVAIDGSTTPHDTPDPDTGQPRYSATYQLTVKCR